MTPPASPSAGVPRPSLARGLALAVIAGLFLALAGAFGTGAAPLWRRLLYWIPVMAVGALWGGAAARLVFRQPRFAARPWVAAAVLAMIVALPFTAVVWAATAVAFGYPLRSADLPGFFVPVLAVSAAMIGLNLAAGVTPPQTHAAGTGDGPPRFLDRLPLKLKGAEIYAVEAEDHYLRLHTSRGSDLILMRLSDAVDELEGIEGAQTHRSWWVARAALVEARRGDGRAVLTLKDGSQAPVSRSYARALRQAGWF